MSLNEETEAMLNIAEDDEPEETVDDELLPEWARRNTFVEDDLGWYTRFLAIFSTDS